MSYEAWGDGGDDGLDHLIDDGWWTADQAKEVCDQIEKIAASPALEDDQVSAQLRAEIVVLQNLAGLLADTDPKVKEAERVLAAQHRQNDG